MEILKVGQASDLHYSANNLVESDRTFGFAVDHAIQNGVDAFIITGDSTDHALDAHSPSLMALAKQIKKQADFCPVLMLQGTFSHEPVGLLKMFQLIGAKYPICIADKIGMYGLTEDGFEPFINGKDYRLLITAFPSVNKADLVATGGGKAAGEIGDILFGLMQEFAKINVEYRSRGVPTMLIGHGTVVNCQTEHGVPMSGLDHEFGVGALFSALTDVVALGHIHKHQVWSETKNGFPQTIAYAGSIGRFHHGEEGDKHYLNWNMSAGNSSFDAIVTPSRVTIDIFFDGPPDLEVIRSKAAECANAYVRVRYQVDEEHRLSIDRSLIKTILAGAADVQIEGTTLIIERSRAAGISTAQSTAQKLVKWCEVTTTQSKPLLPLLSLLETTDPTDIAKAITDEVLGKKVKSVEQPLQAIPETLF